MNKQDWYNGIPVLALLLFFVGGVYFVSLKYGGINSTYIGREVREFKVISISIRNSRAGSSYITLKDLKTNKIYEKSISNCITYFPNKFTISIEQYKNNNEIVEIIDPDFNLCDHLKKIS